MGLPGGRVDVGESALDAAVRETAEESGVLVRVTGCWGVRRSRARRRERGGGGPPAVRCVPEGVGRPGRPRPDLHETIKAGWFETGDVAGLPLEARGRTGGMPCPR